MRRFIKTLVAASIIFLIVAGIFSLTLGEESNAKAVPLSKVAEQITSGQVEKIEVRNNELLVILKDDSLELATKEPESSLSESLTNLGVPAEALRTLNIEVKGPSGFSVFLSAILPFVIPFVLIAAFIYFLTRQVAGANNRAMSFGQSQARLTDATVQQKVTFSDVAGAVEAKEELKEIIEFLRYPQKFLNIGARIPKGVLLLGPPGCGKTLLARAVAGEANVPFFHMSGSEFVEMFVGVGAARTRDLFRRAKKHAPCIVFIDEIDAVGRQRGTGLGGSHDEREQTLNQILVEMDGFDTDTNVIVIAASVTGDTPVLVKKDGNYELKPIAEIIDPYYRDGEENKEKPTPGLEVLGLEKTRDGSGNVDLQRSAFKKVRSVFRHKVNEIYEVEYVGGKIRTTGNHSLFVRTPYGIHKKPVSQMKPGEILVDLPYKVNREGQREMKTHEFSSALSLELPVYEPVFTPHEVSAEAYDFALANQGKISQSTIANRFGLSQTVISHWQRGWNVPRDLSRKYFKHQLPETIQVTPGFMRLLGYYAAEGYARKELDFCFNEKEKEKVADLKDLMQEIFGLTPDQERHQTPNAINVIYYSKLLAQFFAKHCGAGAHNKHIPSFLFVAPTEYFIEFLRGYAAGDGHQVQRGRNTGNLVLVSVSKRLILELNWLSRMHGHVPYFAEFAAEEGRRIRQGKPLKKTQAYRLEFGKSNNPLMLNSSKRQALHTHRFPVIKQIIKLPYDGFVYDFCGCENEAFFAGEKPVLASNTNRPDVLDPALLRPGRFDRQVVIDQPDIKDREEILKVHARGKPLARDVELRRIAERTPGFSGADLSNLVNEGAILAARRDKKQISQGEFFEAIEKVMLGPERKSHVLSPKEKEIAAYHEAGHALVAASLPQADPVHKVSIIARGRAAGYTLKLPTEDKHLRKKSEFLADLAVAMGGYAAEELVFGELTTGASNDLQIATNLARKLVMVYGMSKKLGPITFGERSELIFLGKEIGEQRNYSEKVAQKIDEEVWRFLGEAQRTAAEICKKYRSNLEAIAKRLVEKETIEQEEFKELVKNLVPGQVQKKKAAS